MRRWFVCVSAVLVSAALVRLIAIGSEQLVPPISGAFMASDLRVQATNLTEFVGDIKIPVTRPDGAIVGSANLVSILANPELPYLPTVMSVTMDGNSFVLIDVRSQDGLFHSSFAYQDSATGPLAFFQSNGILLKTSSKRAELLFELGAPALIPVAGPTYENALWFEENPHVQTFPGLNLSHRRSLRKEVLGFNNGRDAGDNINVSGATPDQAFVLNVLRGPNQQPRFIVICAAPSRPCGAFRFGPDVTLFGDATAGNIGATGLVPLPNAVSVIRFTQQVDMSAATDDTCPPGVTPPMPEATLGWLTTFSDAPGHSILAAAWLTSPCADGYMIELIRSNGIRSVETVAKPYWQGNSDQFRGVTSFRVAAVSGPNRSAFSAEEEFVDPTH